MSNWTTYPPEREGWYFVAAFWELRGFPRLESEHPCHFREDGTGGWEYWAPFEMHHEGSSYAGGYERTYIPWGEFEAIQRSIHPLTPPPFEEDDRCPRT